MQEGHNDWGGLVYLLACSMVLLGEGLGSGYCCEMRGFMVFER